ncbi:MAG: hypothetical protein RBS45_14215, partial [Anaerolineales bacterium]|nr:hypothetical protein [Anaerolineales bacterium]
IASLPSSASALEIAQTARQTFCHLASTHSTMGKLTTLNCGATRISFFGENRRKSASSADGF